MAAATDFESDGASETGLGADHGGLDVGYLLWGDYESGFGRGGGVEAEVLDVGLEDGGEGRVCGSVDNGGRGRIVC